MKASLRTPEQVQFLEGLRTQTHSLNGVIPSGRFGKVVEIKAQVEQLAEQPMTWQRAVRITGLAGRALADVMDRIAGAFRKLQIELPEVEILVQLCPADLPMDGISLDLPIAIILLQAAGILPPLSNPGEYLLFGGLDIDGEVRRVSCALLLASKAIAGQKLIVPAGNAQECALIQARRGFEASQVYPVSQLSDVVAFFKANGESDAIEPVALNPATFEENDDVPDFGQILGHDRAKRAAIILAAGGHNLLMIGPNGIGKSQLAKAIPGILPRLSNAEKYAQTLLHYTRDDFDGRVVTSRPMRTVHSNASLESIVGGGSKFPKPGLISLAHLGVLFLDEFADFPKLTLEALKQPLEDRQITVSRVGGTETFPANCTLLAAMNPCPCGAHGTTRCSCSKAEIRNHRRKISEAMSDRIELQVDMKPLTLAEESAPQTTGESAKIRLQVEQARALQSRRFEGHGIPFNAAIPGERTREFCLMSDEAENVYRQKMKKSDRSKRSKDRLLKVARTIADLDGSELIEPKHISEASGFFKDEMSRDEGPASEQPTLF